MQERSNTKQNEMRALAAHYQKHPELFEQQTFIEDAEFLKEFGIFIPDKEHFMSATLKVWPEDFIVEEIGADGKVETISLGSSEPSGEGKTVFATLVKCGLSTIEVVEDLCRILGVAREDISYAGIKDKDALTAQRISIRRTTPEAVRIVSSPYFFLKDIVCGKGVVEKGRLKGNRFTILLRTEELLDEPHNSEVMARALQAVQEKGFYNFFYLQRFGTPRLRNYEWAYHILLGNYRQAVFDHLTAPSTRELGYFKKLRGEIEAKFGQWAEIKKLLEPYPIMLAHENKVVDHLLKNPEDYAGALASIPDQITLWMYALASLFFNQKISFNIERNQEPPDRLPFFLSNDKADWDVYRATLQKYELYPPPFKNLRPFQVLLKKRDAQTKDRAKIIKGEVTDKGLLLQFELGKGQYATTFLSHLFNLTAGKLPEKISRERLDTKALVGDLPIAPVIERFASVIRIKGENAFEGLLEKVSE